MCAACVSHRFNDAHTTKLQPASSFTVVAGAHELYANESSQTRHSVTRVILHEKYVNKPAPPYDIMLLQLNNSIHFDDNIRPICVDASVFPTDSKCMVTGWGSTNKFGQNLLLNSKTLSEYNLDF